MILKKSRIMASNIRSWRTELDRLAAETGITFRAVCDYTGMAYNENEIAFYTKMPKRRSSFIGIGMAYHQPLDVINDWIMRYGGRKKLYAKDISEDLVWIYLINANAADPDTDRNYFQLYEKCQEVAFATWQQLWDEITIGSVSTADVEIQLENVDYDDDFKGLKDFIIDHMDSFKTAYVKPRRMLDRYVDQILETCGSCPEKTGIRNINDLRGWLDDSMITYLFGNTETINTIDPKTRKKTIRIKRVPKNKRTHIALCLALGMSVDEINVYLTLMGYSPLAEETEGEKTLIEMLKEWEKRFPLPGLYKKLHFGGSRKVRLTPADELHAVEDMLTLRQTLKTFYKIQGIPFPYLK